MCRTRYWKAEKASQLHWVRRFRCRDSLPAHRQRRPVAFHDETTRSTAPPPEQPRTPRRASRGDDYGAVGGRGRDRGAARGRLGRGHRGLGPEPESAPPQEGQSSDRDLRVRRDTARLRAHQHRVRVRGLEQDPHAAAAGDGGDRGPALLPARGARLPGHRPREREGPARRRQCAARRLHADDAARQQHVHPRELPRASRPQVQDRSGQAGRAARVQALQAMDSRFLPERGPVRHFERPGGGRRRGGCADVLQPAGVEAQPGADVAARRAARSRPPSTTRSFTPSSQRPGATPCCRRW